MNEQIESDKKEIGEYLSALRKQKGISRYKINKLTGVKINVINSIEESSSAYTFDSFLKYVSGLGMRLSFEEKGESSGLRLSEKIENDDH